LAQHKLAAVGEDTVTEKAKTKSQPSGS
jgi:hypothetical protein